MSDRADNKFISDRDMAILHALTGIVCASVSKPGAHDVVGLISDVHAKLVSVLNGAPEESAEGAVAKPTPAEIRRSVMPSGIVSFIDGKTYQTLKRHLGVHGLTPESYRTRFGLSADYPMTAPAYSERRSALAKAIGLGQLRAAPTEPMQAAA